MYSLIWNNSMSKYSSIILCLCIIRHYMLLVTYRMQNYIRKTGIVGLPKIFPRKLKKQMNLFKKIISPTINIKVRKKKISDVNKKLKTFNCIFRLWTWVLQLKYFISVFNYYFDLFTFYRYKVAFFFDKIMQFVPTHSMTDLMKIVASLFRTTGRIFGRSWRVWTRKHYSYTLFKTKSIIANTMSLFKKLKIRRLINRTSKKFGTRKSLKLNLNMSRKSDYLKYRLSLFFIASFNMTLKTARLLYTNYYKSENINTFADFFIFLEKKIDLFFNHYLQFSITELKFCIKNRLLFINDSPITNLNSFIQIGDFIKIKSIKNHSHLSGEYSYFNLNLLDRKWFFFFYYLTFSNLFYLRSFFQNPINKFFSIKILGFFFVKLFSFKRRLILLGSKINVGITKYSFLYNYLEIIKGITSYFLVLSKKPTNFWNSLTWYHNLIIEKPFITSYSFCTESITHYNTISFNIINKLTKISTLMDFHYHVIFYMISSLHSNNLLIKQWFKILKLNNCKFITMLTQPRKKSTDIWMEPLRFKLFKMRLNGYSIPKILSDPLLAHTKNSIVKIATIFAKRFFLLFDSISYYNYLFFNSRYYNSLNVLKIVNLTKLKSFLCNNLETNLFLYKTNSFSYWWLFFTSQLKKIFIPNVGNKYLKLTLENPYECDNDIVNSYSQGYWAWRLYIKYNSIKTRWLDDSNDYYNVTHKVLIEDIANCDSCFMDYATVTANYIKMRIEDKEAQPYRKYYESVLNNFYKYNSKTEFVGNFANLLDLNEYPELLIDKREQIGPSSFLLLVKKEDIPSSLSLFMEKLKSENEDIDEELKKDDEELPMAEKNVIVEYNSLFDAGIEIPDTTENLFFSDYLEYDYYQYPELYFESLSNKKLDLYNESSSLFYSEMTYLFYRFYSTLSTPLPNSFIFYKNVVFIYKIPKNDLFFENKSKWFSTFNLKDISKENVSTYI